MKKMQEIPLFFWNCGIIQEIRGILNHTKKVWIDKKEGTQWKEESCRK